LETEKKLGGEIRWEYSLSEDREKELLIKREVWRKRRYKRNNMRHLHNI
jgi:hypothetical protein